MKDINKNKKGEFMEEKEVVKKPKKEENKVNFDLSDLSLKDLVSTYEEIAEFIKFLEEKIIVPVQKVEEDE